MDEYDFVKMISQDETQVTDEVFLADYNVYLERIFICDPVFSDALSPASCVM